MDGEASETSRSTLKLLLLDEMRAQSLVTSVSGSQDMSIPSRLLFW